MVSWAAAETAAADREEVVVGAADGDAEDLAPLLGEPGLGAVQLLGGPPVSSPRSGQGSALRSTLPDVRVGSSATGASSGTSAAGSSARSRSTAAAWSQPSWVTT